MSKKFAVLMLFAVSLVIFEFVTWADGDCSIGITKDHLDTTTGEFVDNVTIEINDTNGLTVKAIPDDSVTTGKIDSIFGSWTSIDSDTNTLAHTSVYKATSDGFVVGFISGVDQWQTITCYTDSSSSPTTIRQQSSSSGGTSCPPDFSMPVKKNDYWKVTRTATDSAPTIYWMPIGNGQCQKQ